MDKKTRAYILAGSVFTISTTIAQVISIENDITIWSSFKISAEVVKWVLFLVNLLAWLWVLIVISQIRSRRIRQQHANNLISRLPQGEIQYKHVESRVELEIVWTLDQSAYKDQNISKDRLSSWWEKNKYGLFVRNNGGGIEASIGLWPITEKAFMEIIGGRKTDVELTTLDLVNHENENESCYWYLSGVLTYTTEDILYEFVGYAFKRFIERIGDNAKVLNIAFMPMTSSEVSILKPLGFTRVNQTGKLPVWCYTRNSLEHMRSVSTSLLSSSTSINIYQESEGITDN